MKSELFFVFATTSALVIACNDDASTTQGMGQGGAAPGGSSQGGAIGSGGSRSSGGVPSSGGERASGGALGSGGAELASGGATGGSNASGASSRGGQGSGGAASGGTAGTATSAGGKAGEGGAAKGGSSSAGAAGASAGAAGATNDTKLAGAFDGALLTYPCGTGHSGFDCDNIGCSNGQVTHAETYRLGGESSTVYDLTFRVRGVVEAYNYVGGTRDAGNASIASNQDLFLRGGAAQAAGASGYDYDVYELDVAPAVSGSPATYFLNSVSSAENPHTSSATLHLTFAIDYTKTIRVPGGGTITVKQFDSNCKSVMNCGKTAGNSCAAPRSVSLSDAMPPAPASFAQPYQMPAGAYGQWLFFDVTSVVPVR